MRAGTPRGPSGLWAVAERMVAARGDAFQPPERTVNESAVTDLRAHLGEATFAAEHAAGRGWTDEREVLRLVGNGWTNERIGEELFLSPRTIQSHLTNIFRKIDVDNRTEAVRWAVDAGLA